MGHLRRGGEPRDGQGRGAQAACSRQGPGRKIPARAPLGRAAGQKSLGWWVVLWTLTWWASHSCWAPAASVSLGADGPRKPPGPHSVWGRNVISSGLARAPPWPLPAPTISRKKRGPRGFSGSRQPWSWWGEAGVYVIPRACPPPPILPEKARRRGRICWASRDPSAQGPLEIWEDPGPQGG